MWCHWNACEKLSSSCINTDHIKVLSLTFIARVWWNGKKTCLTFQLKCTSLKCILYTYTVLLFFFHFFFNDTVVATVYSSHRNYTMRWWATAFSVCLPSTVTLKVFMMRHPRKHTIRLLLNYLFNLYLCLKLIFVIFVKMSGDH